MTPKFDKLVTELKMPTSTRQSQKSFLNIPTLKKTDKKKKNSKPPTRLSGNVKHDGPPPGSTPATGLAMS